MSTYTYNCFSPHYIQLVSEQTCLPIEILSQAFEYSMNEDTACYVWTRLASNIIRNVAKQTYQYVSACPEWNCISYHSTSLDDTIHHSRSSDLCLLMRAVCIIFHTTVELSVKTECSALFPSYFKGWSYPCRTIMCRAGILLHHYTEEEKGY